MFVNLIRKVFPAILLAIDTAAFYMIYFVVTFVRTSESNTFFNSDQILSGKPSILEVNDSEDRYKAARETLFSLGLIENGGCYNSLVDKKGNVLAEAEFVLVFKN